MPWPVRGMLGRRAAASRKAACGAAAVIVAVTVVRVLSLPLPVDRWVEEIALSLLATAYAVVAIRLLHYDWTERDLLVLLQGAVPALLAAGLITTASGYLPHADLVAVLLFTAIHLAAPPSAPWRTLIGVTIVVDAIFAATWLTWASGDLPTLAMAILFMAGLQLIVVAQAHAAGISADSEKTLSSAHAATAERVGTAIDVNGVTRAVLEISRESYPLTTLAAVLLYDSASDRLRPLPLYLGPSGVTALESDNLDFALAPGEGLAGKVFASSRPMLWPTAFDVHMAQANLSEQPRVQLLALRRGVTQSAIGAPLVVDDEVIGAYVLASNRQELAWSADDLPVVSALAGEAARAIERARRYERELDQAHLDSITGLANHRQLTRTLDQEVARARRRNSSLGVVFCDLDRFKAVNDTYGHAAGDRVLTILARVFHDSLRREDSAARYGGDEFVCVLPGADRAETDAVGRRIATSFEARVRDDPELSSAGVTISCGAAIFPADGDGVEALLDHADAAMRVVKVGRRTSVPGSVRPGP